MAGTNFLQINPSVNNQESDAAYAADSIRVNGAATNALLPSPLFNKAMYQQSTFIASLAQALVSKGYSPVDGATSPGTAVANLAGVLANIMTQADMSVFARLLSPIFTGVPQAPTPAPGDNSTKIATTAFIAALLGSGFVFVPGNNGYIKFPSTLGGFMIQWMQGGSQGGGAGFQHVLTFPVAFPTACLHVSLTTQMEAQHNDGGQWYQVLGQPNRFNVTTFLCNSSNVNPPGTFTCFMLALGY